MILQVVLPLGLAFIMFSMGLGLTFNDFKRVASFPRAFFIGSFLQLISLPLIAFILAKFWVNNFALEASFAAGLMLIAACPGGVTSNLMTGMAKGDVALSISLTAIISIVAVFTIPFVVNFSLNHFGVAGAGTELPLLKTILGVFFITVVPAFIGLMVNTKKPHFSQSFEPRARMISSVIFVIIVIAAILKDWNLMLTGFGKVGGVTLTFNIITMLVAYFVSRLLRLSKPQARAITLECGLQNGTLAIFIALSLLQNEVMMLPAGIYSILMFFTGIGYILSVRKRPLEVAVTP